MDSCRALMTGSFQLVSWTNLHGFNTWSWNKVPWSIKYILDLPKYKKSAFCQRISQLHKNSDICPNKGIVDKFCCFMVDLRMDVWGKRLIFKNHQVPLLPYFPNCKEKYIFSRQLVLPRYDGRSGILHSQQLRGVKKKAKSDT